VFGVGHLVGDKEDIAPLSWADEGQLDLHGWYGCLRHPFQPRANTFTKPELEN
jgi:hypothetical protein